MLAPRRVALATLPVLPLVAASMPVVATSATRVAWGRIGGLYSTADLLRFALPRATYVGVAVVVVAGVLAVWLLLVVRSPRARIGLAAAGVMLSGGLWIGGGLYYGALRASVTRSLEPSLVRFLTDEVLQSPGAIKWCPLVWLGRFPHARATLSGSTTYRADASFARIILFHIPAGAHGLSDVEFAEGSWPWRDQRRPQFAIVVTHPQGYGHWPPTPADLVKLGWLRPSLGAEFMAHPTSAGTYAANVAGLRVEYSVDRGSPMVRFCGRYRESGRE